MCWTRGALRAMLSYSAVVCPPGKPKTWGVPYRASVSATRSPICAVAHLLRVPGGFLFENHVARIPECLVVLLLTRKPEQILRRTSKPSSSPIQVDDNESSSCPTPFDPLSSFR